MRVTCDPPFQCWQLAPGPSRNRTALTRLLQNPWHDDHAYNKKPLIATGHQPWLWHPGILAKYIAAANAALRLDATPLNLVVDHDIHDTQKLAVPIKCGHRMDILTIQMSAYQAEVPSGCQPAANVSAVIDKLVHIRNHHSEALQVDLAPLIEAYGKLAPCNTMAQQMAALIDQLITPYTPTGPSLFSSHFHELPQFRDLVHQMAHDAPHCAKYYNAAVLQYPNAGIAMLDIQKHRIELPLWLLRWQQPRQRVYVDIANPYQPRLVTDQQAVTPDDLIAPRSVLMSAAMRSICCDLFVHGHGGGVYDQVTQQWWQQWHGTPLAPMVVASADITLDFDVPVNDFKQLQKAIWWKHHLPHNLDRALNLKSRQATQKHHLISHMNDDRDKTRRAMAYKNIQSINRELAHANPDPIRDADTAVKLATQGLCNQQIAQRRDWCFAFYPPRDLKTLADTFT